jgi:hypothetical protein
MVMEFTFNRQRADNSYFKLYFIIDEVKVGCTL